MKMPNEPSADMFAPCGMNCLACYKHCYSKKPCAGCLKDSEDKPKHCRKCSIKECTKAKSITYCFECTEYPCNQTRNLEKTYVKRYRTSLLENSQLVRQQGREAFMKQQAIKYTCPQCGGVISLHDAQCSECKYQTKEKLEETSWKK